MGKAQAAGCISLGVKVRDKVGDKTEASDDINW